MAFGEAFEIDRKPSLTLVQAIREYRNLAEPLTLRGSEYARAAQELNKAIDRAEELLCGTIQTNDVGGRVCSPVSHPDTTTTTRSADQLEHCPDSGRARDRVQSRNQAADLDALRWGLIPNQNHRNNSGYGCGGGNRFKTAVLLR
jgi:hypothetical protein